MPKSFDEFTVSQFMAWHEILKQDIDPIDREYRLLSMLLGITQEQCEDIPLKQIDPMLRIINGFKFKKPSEKIKRVLKLNGKYYIPVIYAKHLRELMTASQYTAFKEYTKTDAVEHMDKILALLYTPFKLFRKPKLSDKQMWLANEFKSAKIGDVYGFVFFLSKQYQKLSEASLPYFQNASLIIENHMKEVSLALEEDS